MTKMYNNTRTISDTSSIAAPPPSLLVTLGPRFPLNRLQPGISFILFGPYVTESQRPSYEAFVAREVGVAPMWAGIKSSSPVTAGST